MKRALDIVLPDTESGGWPPEEAARVRRWSAAVVAASVVFVAAWLLAAAWQGPRYSVTAHSISDMYADGAPGAAFLVVVITLCGAVVLGFAWRALWPSLRRAGRPAAAGVALLAVRGPRAGRRRVLRRGRDGAPAAVAGLGTPGGLGHGRAAGAVRR